MQRVFVRGLVGGCLVAGAVWLVSGQSWSDLWSLLGVCLAAGTVRPVSARSLVDRQWLAAATPAAVRARLEQGASLTMQDEDGATPLHLAARANATTAVVALLLDHGADATLRDKADKLPLDYADKNEALKGTDVYRRLHDAQS